MSAPRHLWSGDWRLDSAAAAEELAERRSLAEERTAPPAEQSPSKVVRARPTAGHLTRTRERLRRGRRGVLERLSGVLRDIRGRWAERLLIGVGTLLAAGAAYGAVSLVAGSGGGRSGSETPAWLGVDMAGSPFPAVISPASGSGFPFANGALVLDVIPGSPGAAAGLEPGDVVTEIDNQQVSSPAQVNSIIARLHSGDRVQIQYDKALTTYTTQTTLTARPAGSP